MATTPSKDPTTQTSAQPEKRGTELPEVTPPGAPGHSERALDPVSDEELKDAVAEAGQIRAEHKFP